MRINLKRTIINSRISYLTIKKKFIFRNIAINSQLFNLRLIPKICFNDKKMSLKNVSINDLKKLHLSECCSFYDKIQKLLKKDEENNNNSKKYELIYLVKKYYDLNKIF